MTRRRRARPGPGDASRADAPIGPRTPGGLDRKEDGPDKPSLEHPDLDACRSIPAMAARFMEAGRDQFGYVVVIAGADGVTRLDGPFDERLRRPYRPGRPDRADPASPPAATAGEPERGRRPVATMGAQAADMAAEAERVRAVVEESDRLLRLSRAGARP